MSAWDYMPDDLEDERDDEGYYFHNPKPPTPRRTTKMHRYKILVVISSSSGLTSQLLHYVNYEDAETAYGELSKGLDGNGKYPAGFKVNYIRLYKPEARGWRG